MEKDISGCLLSSAIVESWLALGAVMTAFERGEMAMGPVSAIPKAASSMGRPEVG